MQGKSYTQEEVEEKRKEIKLEIERIMDSDIVPTTDELISLHELNKILLEEWINLKKIISKKKINKLISGPTDFEIMLRRLVQKNYIDVKEAEFFSWQSEHIQCKLDYFVQEFMWGYSYEENVCFNISKEENVDLLKLEVDNNYITRNGKQQITELLQIDRKKMLDFFSQIEEKNAFYNMTNYLELLRAFEYYSYDYSLFEFKEDLFSTNIFCKSDNQVFNNIGYQNRTYNEYMQKHLNHILKRVPIEKNNLNRTHKKVLSLGNLSK